MITLTEQLSTFIFNCIRTANQAKLTMLVFEEGIVKGMQEGAAFVMIETENIPEFPFENMSINRVDALLSRYTLVHKDGVVPTVQIELAERVRNGETLTYVRRIVIESTATSVDFKCAHPNVIKVPSKLTDVVAHRIVLTADVIDFLKRSQAAMGADEFCIDMHHDKTVLSVSDINSDAVTRVIAAPKVLDAAITLPVKYAYAFKTTIDLLKQSSPDVYITGRLGFMQISINNMTTYIARNAK